MKNIAMSLLAALIIATPAHAVSWKTEMFSKLDTDTSGELSYGELVSGGCRTESKMFKYADADRSNGLTKAEFFANRDLLGRCK
jgi:hypothetical protein